MDLQIPSSPNHGNPEFLAEQDGSSTLWLTNPCRIARYHL